MAFCISCWSLSHTRTHPFFEIIRSLADFITTQLGFWSLVVVILRHTLHFIEFVCIIMLVPFWPWATLWYRHYLSHPSTRSHVFRSSSQLSFNLYSCHHITILILDSLWPWVAPLVHLYHSHKLALSHIFRSSFDPKLHTQCYFSYPFGHHNYVCSSQIDPESYY